MLKKIDHIGIAVENLTQALSIYSEALGIPCQREEEVLTESVRVAFLPIGDVNLELLEPTSPDASIQKFLAKRGPGIHHICFEVENLEATLTKLKEKGVRLIDEKPRPGAHHTQVAFVHPSGMGGILVELKQAEKQEGVLTREHE